MYQTLQHILIALWIPQAIAQTLVWAFWWQTKEYRFDRFTVLLRKKSGISKLAIPIILFKLVILLLAINIIMPVFIFLFSDFYFLQLALRRKLVRPKFTSRTIFMLAIVYVGVGVILVLPWMRVMRFELSILYSELYLVLGIVLGIFWTKPVVDRAKKRDLDKAKKKLKKINPKIIGITGSYGKSTTKDFLSALISNKYKTEKTTKNQNNEFGISRKVINDFKGNTEIFVAEMGAYKRGEIKLVTSFTTPSISMVTGIEPQHLDLFGNIENIKKAKYEIVDALPEGGLAVFNLSNENCKALYKKAEKNKKIKVYGYKLVEKFPKKLNFSGIVGKIIKIGGDGIEFKVRIDDEIKDLSTNINASHLIENLIGAILVARKLDVSWADISKACKSLVTPDHTMQIYKLKNGITIIDDTYNSTPIGFESALETLFSTKAKNKVVITSGIIELGTYSHVVHTDLGHMMKKQIDMIVLTEPDFASDLAKGLGNEVEKLIVEPDISALKDCIDKITEKNTIVLLEGRLPGNLVSYIESRK